MNQAEPIFPAEQLPDLGAGQANVGVRLLIAALLGTAVAFFLTWFMSFLIATGQRELDESERIQLLDFVRVQPNENVQTKERLPSRPEQTPPPEAPEAPAQESQSSANHLAVSALPTGAGDGLNLGFGLGFGGQDGDYLPIVKIAAVYPLSARQRRLEGTCLTEYTVTKTGSVRDVSIVPGECTHSVFERVSIEAARKFKYKPRIVNQEAIEVPGVYNRFIFKMQTES